MFPPQCSWTLLCSSLKWEGMVGLGKWHFTFLSPGQWRGVTNGCRHHSGSRLGREHPHDPWDAVTETGALYFHKGEIWCPPPSSKTKLTSSSSGAPWQHMTLDKMCRSDYHSYYGHKFCLNETTMKHINLKHWHFITQLARALFLSRWTETDTNIIDMKNITTNENKNFGLVLEIQILFKAYLGIFKCEHSLHGFLLSLWLFIYDNGTV